MCFFAVFMALFVIFSNFLEILVKSSKISTASTGKIFSTKMPIFYGISLKETLVSFAFCAHVDLIKYRKSLTFSFKCTQIS